MRIRSTTLPLVDYVTEDQAALIKGAQMETHVSKATLVPPLRQDDNTQVATIRSVAEQAGVSTATVSRFLNSQHVVRAATQKRISAAISKLQYEPNMWARQLSLSRNRGNIAARRRTDAE